MGWPIKKKYDPLRIIAPIISQEAGNGKLFEKLMVMVENFRILLDLLGCDLTEELEAVIMECVEIYRILGVEDPVSETCKELIKLIDEPVRSLGLLGLYCT
jgi:hypothetical protein